MVGGRNKVLKLISYINSLGITVNIGKTKARGNNGIFVYKPGSVRIDVAKNLPEEKVLSVILHELAHYIHYTYDKTMKSLDFVFGSNWDAVNEELISITVQEIPKGYAAILFSTKNEINSEIKFLSNDLKKTFPDFKQTGKYKPLEKGIKFPFSYLLRYDAVKVLSDVYKVNDIDNKNYLLSDDEKKYIKLKSKQRQLKRINSKINRLNRYYNNRSELFARFFESYFTKPEITRQKAPFAFDLLKNSNIIILKDIENIMFCKTL